jgi:hypothetical protein
MKKIVLTLIATTFISTAFAEAGLKQVCHDKLDKSGKPVLEKKTAKPVQNCKMIKTHKKLEGADPVPVKK